MPIPVERYFLFPGGSAAVSTTSSDQGGGQFKSIIEIPSLITFVGSSNAVMDELSRLSNHFAAAREAVLLYLTEGGG